MNLIDPTLRRLRNSGLFTLLMILSCLAVSAWAQAATPPPPAAPGGAATASAGASLAGLAGSLALLIPVVVPLIISQIKTRFLPKTPSWALPLLAPVLGVLVDYVMQLAGAHTPGTLAAVVLGAAGVGLREVVDQLHQALPDQVPSAATKAAAVLVALLFITGCNFVNASRKSIAAAAFLGDGAMKSYAVYWKDATNRLGDTPQLEQQRSNVMSDSYKVGFSLQVADQAVESYASNVGTNKATKAVVNALLLTAVQNAGNFAAEVGVLTGTNSSSK